VPEEYWKISKLDLQNEQYFSWLHSFLKWKSKMDVFISSATGGVIQTGIVAFLPRVTLA
jgi:hypothetical protein